MSYPPRPLPEKPPAFRLQLPSTFRALRHRNYRLYFIGQMVSWTGSWLQIAALSWLAYDLTGQSRWTAWLMAAQVLPTCLLGFWGGSLADRFPRRQLILTTQVLFLLLALVLAGLVYAGVASAWQFLVIAALNGIINAVDLPARLAFVIDMVGREDLANAVALNSLLFNVARAVGPALAGMLLVQLGPGACFLLNALSFAAVLAALLSMRDIATRAGHPTTAPLRDSFDYLAKHPALVLLLALTGIMSLFGWPTLALLPAVASQELGRGEQEYGLLLSTVGAGALFAALAVATFGSPRRQWVFLAAGAGLAALGLVLLSFASSLAVALVACGMVGFGMILFFPTSQSAVQLGAGEHNRGRMLGIWSMVLSGAQPLGNLIGGPAADTFGVVWVLRAQAIGCGTAVLALLLRRIRKPSG